MKTTNRANRTKSAMTINLWVFELLSSRFLGGLDSAEGMHLSASCSLEASPIASAGRRTIWSGNSVTT